MWKRDFWGSHTGKRKTNEEANVETQVECDGGLALNISAGVGMKWSDSVHM